MTRDQLARDIEIASHRLEEGLGLADLAFVVLLDGAPQDERDVLSELLLRGEGLRGW